MLPIRPSTGHDPAQEELVMPTLNRSIAMPQSEVGVYHVHNRCVQQAFLLRLRRRQQNRLLAPQSLDLAETQTPHARLRHRCVQVQPHG